VLAAKRICFRNRYLVQVGLTIFKSVTRLNHRIVLVVVVYADKVFENERTKRTAENKSGGCDLIEPHQPVPSRKINDS